MSTSRLRRRLRRGSVAVAAASTLAMAFVATSGDAVAAPPPRPVPGATADGVARGTIDALTPDTVRKLKTAKLGNPTAAPSTSSVTAPAGSDVDPIDMRVLVLATTGEPNPDGVHTVPQGSWDWDLSTLTAALDYTGVPYDVYKAASRKLCVGGTWKLDWAADASATDSTCSSGNVTDWAATTATAVRPGVDIGRLQQSASHSYYQGVMQVNGTLAYADPATGSWVASGLTAEEWATLWTWEASFGLRTVSAFTAPSPDVGVTPNAVDQWGNPLGDGASTTATWTTAGAAAFPYVNATGPLPITNAYTYRGTADPTDPTTQVLLTDSANDALAVIRTYPSQGNRQTLALMFDSAGYLIHGEVLGYGLVSWVTKGLFLGERHAYLDPQPDDLFIADNVWSGPLATCGNRGDDPRLPAFRLTGSDYNALVRWQNNRDNPAISKAFKIEWPFNGEGSTATWMSDNYAALGYSSAKDTLTPTVKANQAKFKFVNHTWSHQNLDGRQVLDATMTAGSTTLATSTTSLSTAWGHTVIAPGLPDGTIVTDVSATDPRVVTLSNAATTDIGSGTGGAWIGVTYDQVTNELQRNVDVAKQLGLATFNRSNVIQPDISGLHSPNFLQAASDFGVKYLISDTSRTGDFATYGVNEGHYNSGTYDPPAGTGGPSGASGRAWNLLEVARYPVNLYYNVSTPSEWLSFDNCLYPSGAPFGHVDDYQQLLDREATVLTRYLLQGHNRPLMFHQPNARAYDGVHSLLGDLMDATLAKYSSLVNVPIVSPTMDQLGQKQAERITYNKALASGQLAASFVPGGRSVSISNTSADSVKVPVTGLVPAKGVTGVTTENYAGQTIAYLTLGPGKSVTIATK